MKIIIGSDHAAYNFKERLKTHLLDKGHEVEDKGCDSVARVNYPDFAKEVCKEVINKSVLGILICGSGIGMSMSANRYKGIRAALCRTLEEAALSKQHNNANILCMGARTTDQDLLLKIADKWLATEFEGGRHSERIELFNNLGESL